MVWDSADELEREGCAAYPFIHNGLQVQETLIEMNDPEEGGWYANVLHPI